MQCTWLCRGICEYILSNYSCQTFQEWKQRKKLRQRFDASKKKLIEMGQDHILQGFSVGNKAQKGLLANQIAGINFKLLQQAMQTIDMPYHR